MDVADRRAVLRERLIEAAERTIAAHGLSALKARDLAEEAGCAIGSVYNVFPDLDALVLQVNLRTLALFEAAIAGAGPASPDATNDLVRLALAYLGFAQAHTRRWRALFQHRMPGAPVPDWYRTEQSRLFQYIEAPLAQLCPGLATAERATRARSLFSSTHGLVALGLDEKLMAVPPDTLAAEVELVVRALGRGLAATPPPAPR